MGLRFAVYRLFLIGIGAGDHARCWSPTVEYTRFGAQVRAAVDNERMARGLGIDVDRTFAITFALGSGLAGLGGALAIEIVGLDPSFALTYLVYVLIVVSVGGLGSISGSFVAASAARHQRRRRQILRARPRRLSHLSGDDRAFDVAAARPVRETLSDGVDADAWPRQRHYFQSRARWRPVEIAFWLATLLPFALFPDYLILASQIAITALFALSLDLILGYAGIVSLGHAAFFGVGAYAAGLLSKYGWGEPITGLLLPHRSPPAIVGYATSFVICRFRHLALIMLTLGFGLMLEELANSAGWLTGGFDGLQGIDTWKLLGHFEFDLYGYVAYGYSLAVLFVLFVFARRLIHSPFGLSLRGIRENYVRMPAIGAPSRAHIRTIYTIAAAMAGIAGALAGADDGNAVARIRSASSARPNCWSCSSLAAPAGSMAGWSAPSIYMIARDQFLRVSNRNTGISGSACCWCRRHVSA